MQQYIHLRKVRFFNTLSKALIILGLGLLIVILTLSFIQPQSFTQLFVGVIVGTLCSQIGLALHNRWGNKPRIDEMLNDSLKGLDDRHAIFHYKLGTDHALISPGGIFALVPQLEDGEITYDGKKWWTYRERRGIFRRSTKRSLGTLDKNAQAEAETMQRSLHKASTNWSEIMVNPIVVFLNQNAVVQIDEPPILTVHAKKLKSLIRRLPKTKSLNSNEIRKLADTLGF